MAVITCQDVIDTLIERPSFFSRLTHEEKLEIISKRPTPYLNLKQVDGRYFRSFRKQWYERKPWLTGSAKKNRLYCFYCILFSRCAREWCEIGIGEDSLKNFLAKAKKHECSVNHITANVKFNELKTKRMRHFSTAATRLSAVKHNEKVDQNRLILKRLTSIVCFLAKQELSFWSEDRLEESHNKGNYLEMIDFLAEREPYLKDHLIYSNVFEATSPDILSDLVTCISDVMKAQISNEINSSYFVSVQVDDTSDISTKPQLSVILRYANNLSGEVEERFVGFYDVPRSKAAENVAEVMLQVLKDFKISQEKLVCQTYDGSSMMVKNISVDALVRQHFPHALFVHCYAHSLNLVLLHCCKEVTQVRIFVANLAGFNNFFGPSSRRTEMLIERGFKIPTPGQAGWNYHSRSVSTIMQHYEQLRYALLDVIKNESWGSDSVHQAEVLINVLGSARFIFHLILFNNIFMYTDTLCSILKNNVTNIILTSKKIEGCLEALRNLRSEDKVNEWLQKSEEILNLHLKNDETHCKLNTSVRDALKRSASEVLNTVIMNFEWRFRDFRNLRFLELVDNNKFGQYSRPRSFPETAFYGFCQLYPCFDKNKLKGELMYIFASEDKHLPPKQLFKYIINSGLKGSLTETVKLLSLILSMPVTTASCERSMCTLKRVKAYLRNSMMNEGLSSFSTLAIEKKTLKLCSGSPEFLSRVVDLFATRGVTYGASLLYRKL